MDAERPLYQKHNSFVALQHDERDSAALARLRLQALRDSPARHDGLSATHTGILDRAISDICDTHADDSPRLGLSGHVIDEIALLHDAELPRYLVHRYRYEVFPQQHTADDYPPYLQIEPSSICNYRCVFCFETDPTFTSTSGGFMGRMSLDMFKRVVDAAEGHVEFVSLASRGEPFMCQDIGAMLEYTRDKFLNLKVNTNASMLDEARCHAILSGGVRTLVFSVDAAAEPLYSQLRVHGKLSVVMENIERFQRIRQTHYPDTRIITRVSGVKVREDQDFNAMQATWSGLVDQVAFVHYNPWENVYNESPNGLSAPCSDLWRRMFVWWDGKVNPCDVDYKSTLSVGMFPQRSLSALWRSAEYEELRQAHLSSQRQHHAPCNRCTVV